MREIGDWERGEEGSRDRTERDELQWRGMLVYLSKQLVGILCGCAI